MARGANREVSRGEVDAARGVHEGRRNRQLQREQRNLDRKESARQADMRDRQQELNRWQRQWEQQRGDRLKRDQAQADRQAVKPRSTNFGNEGYLSGQEDKPIRTGDPRYDAQLEMQRDRMQQQGEQFGQSQQQQAGQFQDRLELDAARSGLEERGAGGGQSSMRDMQGVVEALKQQPDDPRLQRMLKEMMQGREQMGLGLEQSRSSGRWQPTEAERNKRQNEAETSRMNAQTARMNAVNRQRELAMKAQTLQAEIDGGGPMSKEAKAKFKQLEKELIKPLNKTINLQMALSQNKATDKQWSELMQRAEANKANGVAGNYDKIYDEISKREYGPALKQHLSEESSVEAIKYITYSQGRMPEGVIIDTSTEAYQTFVRNGKVASQLLRSGINAELYPIQNTEAWARMVNQLAGFLTLSNRGVQMDARMAELEKPEYARTTKSENYYGRSGQVVEDAQTPGGQTVPRQINTKPKVGTEPIPPDEPMSKSGPYSKRRGRDDPFFGGFR